MGLLSTNISNTKQLITEALESSVINDASGHGIAQMISGETDYSIDGTDLWRLLLVAYNSAGSDTSKYLSKATTNNRAFMAKYKDQPVEVVEPVVHDIVLQYLGASKMPDAETVQALYSGLERVKEQLSAQVDANGLNPYRPDGGEMMQRLLSELFSKYGIDLPTDDSSWWGSAVLTKISSGLQGLKRSVASYGKFEFDRRPIDELPGALAKYIAVDRQELATKTDHVSLQRLQKIAQSKDKLLSDTSKLVKALRKYDAEWFNRDGRVADKMGAVVYHIDMLNQMIASIASKQSK